MSFDSDVVLRGSILVLSLAGLVIALYFTLAYYGRVRKARWVPEVLCAREASSCVTVLQTPYARAFGVPNSLPGILYYLLLVGWISGEWFTAVDWCMGGVHLGFSPLFAASLAAISAGTVALGFYLIYVLRRKLHVNCPLCYVAHAINATLLLLLLVVAL